MACTHSKRGAVNICWMVVVEIVCIKLQIVISSNSFLTNRWVKGRVRGDAVTTRSCYTRFWKVCRVGLFYNLMRDTPTSSISHLGLAILIVFHRTLVYYYYYYCYYDYYYYYYFPYILKVMHFHCDWCNLICFLTSPLPPTDILWPPEWFSVQLKYSTWSGSANLVRCWSLLPFPLFFVHFVS